MYEIWSLGHKPFSDINGTKVNNPTVTYVESVMLLVRYIVT